MDFNKMSAPFHFEVSFVMPPEPAGTFQEISGLETGVGIEAVDEGGENRFGHELPNPVKHSNLALKRAVLPPDARLIAWCRSTLAGGFAEKIEVNDMLLSLVDEKGDAVARWTVHQAYPIKWTMGNLNAIKNELEIESIELAVGDISREI